MDNMCPVFKEFILLYHRLTVKNGFESERQVKNFANKYFAIRPYIANTLAEWCLSHKIFKSLSFAVLQESKRLSTLNNGTISVIKHNDYFCSLLVAMYKNPDVWFTVLSSSYVFLNNNVVVSKRLWVK